MLSEKPWKLMDFLVVMTLLSTLLLVGIFSNLIASTRADVSVDAGSQVVNFTVYLCFYGTILALVHLMVRGRGASWRNAWEPRQVGS